MDSRGVVSRPQAVPRILAGCIACVLFASACATTRMPPPPPHKDVVILLPDGEGKTGAIVVSGAGKEILLSKPRQAVEVAPGAAPGEPFVLPGKEVDALVGPAVEALPQPPLQFVLYFKHDTAELTRESLNTVGQVLRIIKERSPVDISVVGHTDTMGTRPYNNRLGLQRARAVAVLLTKEGIDSSILEITSHGKDNPLVSTGDQVPEPRNRRVEVTVR